MRFWSVVPPIAIALGATSWVLRGWPTALLAALLWAPIAGFFVAGLRSYTSTRLGGAAWWLGAGALAIAAVVAALV